MSKHKMKTLCKECDTASETKDTIAATFREKIIHRVSGIENVDLLEFISNMLDAFKEKWGI